MARYEEARPRILGALLTAASTALARIHRVKLEEIPRMADFAIWAVAAEPAWGLEEGAFLAAYGDNRQASHVLVVESSAIGSPSTALRRNSAPGAAPRRSFCGSFVQTNIRMSGCAVPVAGLRQPGNSAANCAGSRRTCALSASR